MKVPKRPARIRAACAMEIHSPTLMTGDKAMAQMEEIGVFTLSAFL